MHVLGEYYQNLNPNVSTSTDKPTLLDALMQIFLYYKLIFNTLFEGKVKGKTSFTTIYEKFSKFR
jgi:hypothetical protein